jgi:hypothetical protein
MLDLYNNKYERQVLKEHIYAVKLTDILKTQVLDLTFIVRYILSDLYQMHDDDKGITTDMVLCYQPHIKKAELLKALAEYNSDDDSVEDFQSFAERHS